MKVYAARRILTMNPARPEATHVAVRDGRIAAVGTLDELRALGRLEVDDRFADKVLLPGFVEGHTHADAGNVWNLPYCGGFPRTGPDGRVWPALHTVAETIERLRTALRRQDGPPVLLGWGFDPFAAGFGLDRQRLDAVSTSQPVVVMNASGHIAYANTPALRQAGFLGAAFRHEGLPLGSDGLPTGELRGGDVLYPAATKLGILGLLQSTDQAGARRFARLCVRAGVTTATDLGNVLDEHAVRDLLAATSAADFPVRIVSLVIATGHTPRDVVERARALKARSTDRLRLGAIKVVLDGSIQGFTARLLPPGYFNGAPNGLWYLPPEQVQEIYERALDAGLQVHTHTNGDQATELALDLLEAALRNHPCADHRFTLQHAQLADARQFHRMQTLGACVNLFANHLYYWGDAHVAETVGPERAARMNACRSALEAGVPLAIHSDEPVTPMAPLFTAWCAVNRTSAGGRVLGERERIDVAEALHAITLGPAYTLRLEHEVGSIEAGKRADFAVLEQDPLEARPEDLKDVAVWGTILGGVAYPAAAG